MFPGFSNWKTDMYMDVTEGFTSTADKEEFTADELDKLNSIVNAEEELEADLQPTITKSQLQNNKPITTNPSSNSSKNNKKPTTTKTTKSMVMEEEDTSAVMEEEVTTQPDVMEEESQAPAVTTKEGFVGSQIQDISAMRLLLVVIALTATCFIVNLPETGKLIRQVVGEQYCLLGRLLIFAGLTYLILLVKY